GRACRMRAIRRWGESGEAPGTSVVQLLLPFEDFAAVGVDFQFILVVVVDGFHFVNLAAVLPVQLDAGDLTAANLLLGNFHGLGGTDEAATGRGGIVGRSGYG